MTPGGAKHGPDDPKSSKSEPHDVTLPLHKNILMALALYLVLRAAATLLLPLEWRLWGLNFGGFLLPDIDVWIALFLPFVFLLPSIQRQSGRMLQSLVHSLEKPAVRMALGAVVIAACAFLVYNVQVRFPLLGDGSYYLSDVARVLNDPQYESIMYKPTSYLTAHAIAAVITILSPSSAVEVYQFLGVAGMLLLALGAFILLRREQMLLTLTVVTLIGLCAGSLFFFGYVELYVLQYAATILFLIAGWAFLRGHAHVAVPTVLFLAAAGLGGSSAIYLPALVMLFAVQYLKDKPGLLSRIGWGMVALQIVAVAIALLVLNPNREHPFLIPVTGGESYSTITGIKAFTHYSLFSAAHLLDVLNILLLNVGAPMLILAALFPSVVRNLHKDRYLAFGFHAAFSGMLLLVAGHASFGMARDWDLAAIPAAGIVFFAVVVLMYLHTQKQIRLQYVLPAVLVTMLSAMYLWTAVNADERSIDRMESLVAMNDGIIFPQATFQGYEHLRKFYQHQGAEAEHLRIIRKMAETGHLKLEQYRLALSVLLYAKDPEVLRRESSWLFTSIVEDTKSTVPPGYYNYIDQGLLREIAASCLVGFYWEQKGGIVEANAPILEEQLSDWKEAGFVRAVTDTSPSDTERIALANASLGDTLREGLLAAQAGRLFATLGENDRARDLYERSLEIDPTGYPNVYMSLAAIYEAHDRDPEKAVRILELCYERCYFYSGREGVKKTIADLKAHYGL